MTPPSNAKKDARQADARNAKPCQGVMDMPKAKSPSVARYSPKHPQSNDTPNGQNRLVIGDFRLPFLVYDYV